MRYSLRSRFRGAWLGLVAGHALRVEANPVPGLPAIRTAQRLIESHGRTVALAPMVAPSDAELAVATFPIALYFHDNSLMLQQAVRQAIQPWQSGDVEAVLLVGQTIAWALREQLDPKTLIAEVTASLEPSELKTNLWLVQQMLQQNAPLSQVRAQVTTTETGAIALAFFCFLSTPESLPLSINRAARISAVVAALTGILAGSFNGLAGFPLTWGKIYSDPTPISEWQQSGIEMGELSDRLLSVWAGALTPTQFLSRVAIAAPGVMRPPP